MWIWICETRILRSGNEHSWVGSPSGPHPGAAQVPLTHAPQQSPPPPSAPHAEPMGRQVSEPQKPTPEVYVVCPLLLNDETAVGLAGTEFAPVQLGERGHAAHSPQSAGQVSQLSPPLQMLSPHTAGPSKPASFVVMGQSHALQRVPLSAQDWVPAGWRAPQLQSRNVPVMHSCPPLLPVLLPPEPVAPAMLVSPEAPQPRAMPPARPPLRTVHASA